MVLVVIDNGVAFSPNNGVMLRETVLDWHPERLHDAVLRAYSHMGDRFLKDACHGAIGPLAGYLELTYEEYLEVTRAAEEDELLAYAKSVAKKHHTHIRRQAFNSSRSHLVLAMLDAGVRHRCAHDG